MLPFSLPNPEQDVDLPVAAFLQLLIQGTSSAGGNGLGLMPVPTQEAAVEDGLELGAAGAGAAKAAAMRRGGAAQR